MTFAFQKRAPPKPRRKYVVPLPYVRPKSPPPPPEPEEALYKVEVKTGDLPDAGTTTAVSEHFQLFTSRNGTSDDRTRCTGIKTTSFFSYIAFQFNMKNIKLPRYNASSPFLPIVLGLHQPHRQERLHPAATSRQETRLPALLLPKINSRKFPHQMSRRGLAESDCSWGWSVVFKHFCMYIFLFVYHLLQCFLCKTLLND